jgi:RNase P subunit RPR2
MKSDIKSLSKKEIEELIKNLFENDSLSKEKLKKLKQLAMSRNLKLGGMKKRFCKKCYSLFTIKNSENRIKMPFKKIRCKNCNYTATYKIKH